MKTWIVLLQYSRMGFVLPKVELIIFLFQVQFGSDMICLHLPEKLKVIKLTNTMFFVKQ